MEWKIFKIRLKAKISLVFFIVLVTLLGCQEHVKLDNGIIFEGIIKDTTLVENAILEMDIQVRAADGLKSFKIDTKEFQVDGLTEFFTSLSIKANLEEWEGKVEGERIQLSFIAIDQDGDVLTENSMIGVAKEPDEPRIEYLDSDITEDQIWYTGNTYILQKRITVRPQVKLTIQKGVVVKGDNNLQESSALVIAQGAIIDAQGTDSEPIIFTSTLDAIAPGEVESNLSRTYLDYHWWDEKRFPEYSREKGLWGGLVILGKASGSFPGDAKEYSLASIEGDQSFSTYGGSLDNDNSGILKNIYIRYAGNTLNPNKPIGALTLAGVGTRTQIENIEIWNGAENGLSIFGGTVNLKNILIGYIAENAIYIDQDWNGELDNFHIISTGRNGIEVEGPEGSFSRGNHTIENGTITCWPCVGYVSFLEDSNSDLTNILFKMDVYPVGGELYNMKFGINRVPSMHHTTVEKCEVYFSHESYPEDWKTLYFKELSDDMIQKVEYGQHTVGPYLDEFKNWSWVYKFIYFNGSELHGL